MSFNLTSPLPAKGVAVPIYATFTGHERMPFWWAISTNGANPKLRLFEDELELKVVKTHRKPYSHVVVADAYCGKIKTNNLILMWDDTPWTFTANIIQRGWLVQTLDFLARNRIALAPRAARRAFAGRIEIMNLFPVTETQTEKTLPRARMGWFAGAAIVALLLDQLSKIWIRANLPENEALPFVPGWIHLQHIRNHGAAWGVLSGQKWLLILFTLAVTALVVSSAREVSRRGVIAAVGFGWILGGALGNLFDRVVFGYVTDFFDLDTPVRWLQTFPVFNIADSALTGGVILMLFTLLFFGDEKTIATKNTKGHKEEQRK